MHNSDKLFKILQVTRHMPQYGYNLKRIPLSRISNLAEHHYLVTMIAWHIARLANHNGASLNIEKVLEFSLIHDIGEIFGGDISMPYARANPKAREKAKEFERENQKYISKFFGKDDEHISELSREILNVKSDEAIVAKLADYLEITYYLQHNDFMSKDDDRMHIDKMNEIIEKIEDEKAKKFFSEFIPELCDFSFESDLEETWFK